jgi:hypothetical protein
MENIILNINNIYYIKNEIIEKKVKLYNQYFQLDITDFNLIEKLRWYFLFINHKNIHDLDVNFNDNSLIYSITIYAHEEVLYKIDNEKIKNDILNIHPKIKNIIINTNLLKIIEEFYEILRKQIDKIIVVSSYNFVLIDITDKDYKQFRNSYEYETCTKFFRSRFMSRV